MSTQNNHIQHPNNCRKAPVWVTPNEDPNQGIPPKYNNSILSNVAIHSGPSQGNNGVQVQFIEQPQSYQFYNNHTYPSSLPPLLLPIKRSHNDVLIDGSMGAVGPNEFYAHHDQNQQQPVLVERHLKVPDSHQIYLNSSLRQYCRPNYPQIAAGSSHFLPNINNNSLQQQQQQQQPEQIQYNGYYNDPRNQYNHPGMNPHALKNPIPSAQGFCQQQPQHLIQQQPQQLIQQQYFLPPQQQQQYQQQSTQQIDHSNDHGRKIDLPSSSQPNPRPLSTTQCFSQVPFCSLFADLEDNLAYFKTMIGQGSTSKYAASHRLVKPIIPIKRIKDPQILGSIDPNRPEHHTLYCYTCHTACDNQERHLAMHENYFATEGSVDPTLKLCHVCMIGSKSGNIVNHIYGYQHKQLSERREAGVADPTPSPVNGHAALVSIPLVVLPVTAGEGSSTKMAQFDGRSGAHDDDFSQSDDNTDHQSPRSHNNKNSASLSSNPSIPSSADSHSSYRRPCSTPSYYPHQPHSQRFRAGDGALDSSPMVSLGSGGELINESSHSNHSTQSRGTTALFPHDDQQNHPSLVHTRAFLQSSDFVPLVQQPAPLDNDDDDCEIGRIGQPTRDDRDDGRYEYFQWQRLQSDPNAPQCIVTTSNHPNVKPVIPLLCIQDKKTLNLLSANKLPSDKYKLWCTTCSILCDKGVHHVASHLSYFDPKPDRQTKLCDTCKIGTRSASLTSHLKSHQHRILSQRKKKESSMLAGINASLGAMLGSAIKKASHSSDLDANTRIQSMSFATPVNNNNNKNVNDQLINSNHHHYMINHNNNQQHFPYLPPHNQFPIPISIPVHHHFPHQQQSKQHHFDEMPGPNPAHPSGNSFVLTSMPAQSTLIQPYSGVDNTRHQPTSDYLTPPQQPFPSGHPLPLSAPQSSLIWPDFTRQAFPLRQQPQPQPYLQHIPPLQQIAQQGSNQHFLLPLGPNPVATHLNLSYVPLSYQHQGHQTYIKSNSPPHLAHLPSAQIQHAPIPPPHHLSSNQHSNQQMAQTGNYSKPSQHPVGPIVATGMPGYQQVGRSDQLQLQRQKSELPNDDFHAPPELRPKPRIRNVASASESNKVKKRGENTIKLAVDNPKDILHTLPILRKSKLQSNQYTNPTYGNPILSKVSNVKPIILIRDLDEDSSEFKGIPAHYLNNKNRHLYKYFCFTCSNPCTDGKHHRSMHEIYYNTIKQHRELEEILELVQSWGDDPKTTPDSATEDCCKDHLEASIDGIELINDDSKNCNDTKEDGDEIETNGPVVAAAAADDCNAAIGCEASSSHQPLESTMVPSTRSSTPPLTINDLSDASMSHFDLAIKNGFTQEIPLDASSPKLKRNPMVLCHACRVGVKRSGFAAHTVSPHHIAHVLQVRQLCGISLVQDPSPSLDADAQADDNANIIDVFMIDEDADESCDHEDDNDSQGDKDSIDSDSLPLLEFAA